MKLRLPSFFAPRRKAATDDLVSLLAARGFGAGTKSGIAVSPEVALRVPAVLCAIRVIAEDVAKLDASVVRTEGNRATVATDAPEHRIVSRYGRLAEDGFDGVTATEWKEAVIADAALGGAGCAHLNRVGGRAVELYPLRRGHWREEALPGGRLRYHAFDGAVWREVDRADLLILRGPILGLNVSHHVREAVGVALALESALAALARKGGRPHGIISSENVSQDQAARFLDRLRETFGPEGQGGLLPLDVKLELVKLSLSPEEMQLGPSRDFAIEEVARAFRVQPARLMHKLEGQTYASAYQFSVAHVLDTILPWAKRFREAFDMDVVRGREDGRLATRIDFSALLRGSPSERAKYYLDLRNAGAISPADVRAAEGFDFDPRVSDDPRAPLLSNPNPADAAAPKEVPSDES